MTKLEEWLKSKGYPEEKFDIPIKILYKIEEEKQLGNEFFMDLPDRWYEKPGPKWRCSNGHVSVRYLKSERLGYNACLECFEPVHLTFPEDEE